MPDSKRESLKSTKFKGKRDERDRMFVKYSLGVYEYRDETVSLLLSILK